MGAKTWMIVGTDGDAREILKSNPPLDRAATASLARRLFPGEELAPLSDGSLNYTNPPDDELIIGVFPGLVVVAAKELALDRPSTLPAAFLDPALGRTIYLHAMHSVVDWFAFAVWQDGKLVRSLSLSPDDGVIEDIGARLPFEVPYWEGEHPLFEDEPADLQPGVVSVDPEEEYPFLFHPLELGEEALLTFFGYQLEGSIDRTHLDAHAIPLLTFRRPGAATVRSTPSPTAVSAANSAAEPAAKPWWKFW